METVPSSYALILSAALFVVGLAGVLARRNLVIVLMGLEIMLGSAGLAFITAANKWQQPDGQSIMIFILVVAAAEVGVGLALFIQIRKVLRSVDSDEISRMKG